MKAINKIAVVLLIVMSLTKAVAGYQPSSWERQILAACLVLEAADQDEIGMRAVASVIRNRAGGQGKRILGVVKRPYAFSSLNSATTGKTGGSGYAIHVRKASRDRLWSSALRIVDDMYSASWRDVTYGADHYVRLDIDPKWARSMSETAVIGRHRFYSSN